MGVSRQIAVVSYEGKNYVLINPKVLELSGSERREEGCLSVPGVYEEVERPSHVVVEAYDEKGDLRKITGDGFLARAFLHEIDHLQGKLFIDYLSVLKRQLIKKNCANIGRSEFIELLVFWVGRFCCQVFGANSRVCIH